MNDLVSKTVDLVNELHATAQETRFSFIIDDHSQPSVQMLPEQFFSIFSVFDIHETNDMKYPYQVLNEVEGVVFNALLYIGEYEKYVVKKAGEVNVG